MTCALELMMTGLTQNKSQIYIRARLHGIWAKLQGKAPWHS